jgi:hypothetical protein
MVSDGYGRRQKSMEKKYGDKAVGDVLYYYPDEGKWTGPYREGGQVKEEDFTRYITEIPLDMNFFNEYIARWKDWRFDTSKWDKHYQGVIRILEPPEGVVLVGAAAATAAAAVSAASSNDDDDSGYTGDDDSGSGRSSSSSSSAYTSSGSSGSGGGSGTKSKVVAYLLCIFFGFWGIHRIYLGKPKTGILYFFTGGLFAIGWIYDLITLGKQVDKANGKR